ncbi:MAG: exonuclease domain-containing protein [Ardenticatenaceae bacterium]
MNRRQWDALLPLVGLFFFALGAASAALIFVWVGARTEELANAVRQAGWLLLLPLGLLVATGWMINRWVQGYRFAAERLAEEMRLIGAANPAHRVPVKGPGAMPELASAINDLASRFQSLLADQQTRIEQAGADLAAERNRLAALMADLSEGVIVCNQAGQILLYNPPAHRLLGASNNQVSDSFIGLGRSIFTLLEESALKYALERLEERSDSQNEATAIMFVTTTSKGTLLRGRVAPVLDTEQTLNGFILTLEDITESTEQHQRRDTLLHALTEGIRPALANIRASIETIEDYPQMSATRLQAFQGIIRDESRKLSDSLEQAVVELTGFEHISALQSEPMLSDDLLSILQRKLLDNTGVHATIDSSSTPCWLRVDSHALVQAVCQSVSELKEEGIDQAVGLRTVLTGRFAALDLCWAAKADIRAALYAWQSSEQVSATANSATANSSFQNLSALVAQHGGELWHQSDKEAQTLFIRLLLPTIPAPSRPDPIGSNGRAIYYDFDLLFQTPVDNSELEQLPLTSLTYTVFDTETTGLNPSQGDEIVSIGALRIVNGRLLSEERFDQLLYPRRRIPRAATAIHHITDDMVQGQPPIEQVLPRFARFAEDTVLVGHNVAFDMRMFQVKEDQTRVIFTNPVLDTLLLSAVVHPKQEIHTLEAMAERFSITVTERHSSFGDALLTAKLFLKLIPLLAERGITTLQEARQAAQQTYYASIKY